MLWGIPEPLRSVGVEGDGSWGQCGEADFHQWQHCDLCTIAQQRYSKLPPRHKDFHQGRLAICGHYRGHAGLQSCPRMDDRGRLDALRRALMQGFHDEWKGGQSWESIGTGEHGIGGCRKSVLL